MARMFDYLHWSGVLSSLLFLPLEIFLFWWLKPFEMLKGLRTMIGVYILRDLSLFTCTFLSMRIYFNTFWYFQIFVILLWCYVLSTTWSWGGKSVVLKWVLPTALVLITIPFLPVSHRREAEMLYYQSLCFSLITASLLLSLITCHPLLRKLVLSLSLLTFVPILTAFFLTHQGYSPRTSGLAELLALGVVAVFLVKYAAPLSTECSAPQVN